MSSRKSAVWILASNIFFFTVQFGASVLVARLLTPSETGVFAIAMAATWMLHAFQNLGLSNYVVRERELPPEKLGTVITLTVLQGLALALAFWLIGPLLSWMVSDTRVTHAIRILCLYALVLPLRGTLGGLFQRRMRFDQLSLIAMLDVGLGGAVAVIGASVGLSYTSMAWGAVAGLIASTLLSIWWLRADLRIPVTLAYWRSAWSFGAQMLVTAQINNFCSRAPEIILGRLADVTAVGLFNRGSGLVSVFNGAVLASVQRLLQPLLVQHRDQMGSMRGAYLRAVSITTGLTWPVLAGLAILAAPTITLLYGDHWIGAAPVLTMLALATMVDLALCCRTDVLITSGQVKLLSRNEAFGGIAGLVLFAGSIQFGLVAAAASRIPAMLMVVSIYARQVARASDCHVVDIIMASARSVAPTLAAVTPALGLMIWQDWPQHLTAYEFSSVVAVGVVSWVAAIYAVGHELRTEVQVAVQSAFAVFRQNSRAVATRTITP